MVPGPSVLAVDDGGNPTRTVLGVAIGDSITPERRKELVSLRICAACRFAINVKTSLWCLRTRTRDTGWYFMRQDTLLTQADAIAEDNLCGPDKRWFEPSDRWL